MFIDDQTNNPQQGMVYIFYKKGLPPEIHDGPCIPPRQFLDQAFGLLNSSPGD